RAVTSARLASPSNGRVRSRSSPSTRAASAALASPGPIAAATSAGVEPAGISRTDPSGRLIFNNSVILVRLSGFRRDGTKPRALEVSGADGGAHDTGGDAGPPVSGAAAAASGRGRTPPGGGSRSPRRGDAAVRHCARGFSGEAWRSH